ncbi:hypothetical protein BDR26DRAFT_868476 [Obelidium mucronatum]|nr:hypothetical protein BDR26DRAFT_868476 [Obelidium mucronatum]
MELQSAILTELNDLEASATKMFGLSQSNFASALAEIVVRYSQDRDKSGNEILELIVLVGDQILQRVATSLEEKLRAVSVKDDSKIRAVVSSWHESYGESGTSAISLDLQTLCCKNFGSKNLGTDLIRWMRKSGPHLPVLKIITDTVQEATESSKEGKESDKNGRLQTLVLRLFRTSGGKDLANSIAEKVAKYVNDSEWWTVLDLRDLINECLPDDAKVLTTLAVASVFQNVENQHYKFKLCEAIFDASLTWIIQLQPEKITIEAVFSSIKPNTPFNAVSHGWGAYVNMPDDARNDHASIKDSGFSPASSERKLKALQHLRRQPHTWIDLYDNDKARDSPLKQAQLMVMANVYLKAATVLWLPTDRDWIIMEHLRRACEIVVKYNDASVVKKIVFDSSDDIERAKIIRFFATEVKSRTWKHGMPQCDATSILFHSSRGWTLQEFALAKSVVLLDLDGIEASKLQQKQTKEAINKLHQSKEAFVKMDGIPKDIQFRAEHAISQLYKDLVLIGIAQEKKKGHNRKDRSWIHTELCSERECEVEKDIFWCSIALTAVKPTVGYKHGFDHCARHFVLEAFRKGLFAPGVIQESAKKNHATTPKKVRGAVNTSWMPYELFYSDDGKDLVGQGKVNRLRWLRVAADIEKYGYYAKEYVLHSSVDMDGRLVLKGQMSTVRDGAGKELAYCFRVSENGYILCSRLQDEFVVEGFLKSHANLTVETLIRDIYGVISLSTITRVIKLS